MAQMDISDAIKVRYPQPIARAYARVRAEREPVARLLHGLTLVEVITRFATLVGCSAYLLDRGQVANETIERSLSQLRAPSLGTWCSLGRMLVGWLHTSRPDIWSMDWSERRTDLPALREAVALMTAKEPTKVSVAQFLDAIPSFRNDIAHARRDPVLAAKAADLLLSATEELLACSAELAARELLFAERIGYIGPGTLQIEAVLLVGAGAPEAYALKVAPFDGLLPRRVFLALPGGCLLELFPLFHYDTGSGRLYMLEGVEESRPRFTCPHEGDGDGPYVADELKEGLAERISFLFSAMRPRVHSEMMPALRAIFDVAAADGIITPDEMAMLRATIKRLGLAVDPADVERIIMEMIHSASRPLRLQDLKTPSEPPAPSPSPPAPLDLPSSTEATCGPDRPSSDFVWTLPLLEASMESNGQWPALGQGVRYFKHQNQAFAYLTHLHRVTESHVKATRFSQRAIQDQTDYWEEVCRVARAPGIAYRRLTSLTSDVALESVLSIVRELRDAKSFYLGVTGEVADFEIVLRDGEECLVCFHKDDFIIYSALGFDAETPKGGALALRMYEAMFDRMWSRACLLIDFERDVAGTDEGLRTTEERVRQTYQRICEARRLLQG